MIAEPPGNLSQTANSFSTKWGSLFTGSSVFGPRSLLSQPWVVCEREGGGPQKFFTGCSPYLAIWTQILHSCFLHAGICTWVHCPVLFLW